MPSVGQTYSSDACDEATMEAQSTLLRLCLPARGPVQTAGDGLPVLSAVRQLVQWRNAQDAALSSMSTLLTNSITQRTDSRPPAAAEHHGRDDTPSSPAPISLEELMTVTPSYCLATEQQSHKASHPSHHTCVPVATQCESPAAEFRSGMNSNKCYAQRAALHAQLERRRTRRTFVACTRNACCSGNHGPPRHRSPWSGLCQPILPTLTSCRAMLEGNETHLCQASPCGDDDADATQPDEPCRDFAKLLQASLNKSLERYMDAYEDADVLHRAGEDDGVVCRHAATAFVRWVTSGSESGEDGVPSEWTASRSAPSPRAASGAMEITVLVYRDASGRSDSARSSRFYSSHRRLVCGHAFELHRSSTAVTLHYESSMLLHMNGAEVGEATMSAARLTDTPFHRSCYDTLTCGSNQHHHQLQETQQSTSFYRKQAHRSTTLPSSQLCTTPQGCEDSVAQVRCQPGHDSTEKNLLTCMDADAITEVLLRCIETEENELDSLLRTGVAYVSQRIVP